MLLIGASPPAWADPQIGTTCNDTLKIAPTRAGEVVCSIVATSPQTKLEWRPLDSQLETVVMGSTCGPAGSDGDFRPARSIDDYLVWCVTRSYAQYPTWILATP